jgi:predicted membrane chloride channel (bestrophin family)
MAVHQEEKQARPRKHFATPGDEGDEMFSFIWRMFHFRETVLPAIFPQIIFMIFLIIVASLASTTDITIPHGVSDFHSLLGAFLGLVFGMDIGNSLGNYNTSVKAVYKIKGQMRIILANSNTFALRPGANMNEVSALREMIRIKCNTMWLFMRQRMRESRVGFHPGSEFAKAAVFGKNTFAHDPAHPLAAEILSPEDVLYYKEIPVNQRPIAVECELQQLVSQLALQTYCSGEFVTLTHDAINSAMGALTTCMTIINGGALPFLYMHMLKTYILLFVYMNPLLHISEGMNFWNFLSCIVITIGYYGIHEVSKRLLDAFGWNKSDIDLEHYGIAIERTGNLLTSK